MGKCRKDALPARDVYDMAVRFRGAFMLQELP